jgi:hypothetical protein
VPLIFRVTLIGPLAPPRLTPVLLFTGTLAIAAKSPAPTLIRLIVSALVSNSSFFFRYPLVLAKLYVVDHP